MPERRDLVSDTPTRDRGEGPRSYMHSGDRVVERMPLNGECDERSIDYKSNVFVL
jgi:hypothetical protein